LLGVSHGNVQVNELLLDQDLLRGHGKCCLSKVRNEKELVCTV